MPPLTLLMLGSLLLKTLLPEKLTWAYGFGLRHLRFMRMVGQEWWYLPVERLPAHCDD